jgi:hypothetical protein
MELQVWCKVRRSVFAYEYLQHREEFNRSQSDNKTLTDHQGNACVKSLNMTIVVKLGSKLVNLIGSKERSFANLELFYDTESEYGDVHPITKVAGRAVVRCLTRV